MEDMLELEGTSQTLVELYISQSVRPKLMPKLYLEFMEDMLELADISPTLLELFMLQSVKQSQDISMEDMDMVLDMPALDILDMDLVFIMVNILTFKPSVMLTWLEFH